MCSYEQIPELLGSAKMGLNILRPQNEEGHNIRTYEIPATGTLMLSERSRELLNLFVEDKEAVYFSNPDELKQKVEYLLQNPALIKSISEAGYKKAWKTQLLIELHKWRHFIRNFLQLLHLQEMYYNYESYCLSLRTLSCI